jgi:hypothetical protein
MGQYFGLATPMTMEYDINWPVGCQNLQGETYTMWQETQ